MKKYFSLLLLLLAYLPSVAQDPAFSQYLNNRVLLNPAFAGVDAGVRLNLVHRNLWKAVARRNFHTSGVAADMQLCGFPSVGLGIVAMNDVEGEGALTVNNIGLIYAYKIPLNRKSTLSFAMQGDIYSASIDWTKFLFSDQLDPVLGIVGPSTNYNATIQNRQYFDFTSSALYRFLWKTRSKDVFCHLGASFHHLPLGFNQAFLGDAALPMRTTIHGGLLVPVFKPGNRLNYHVLPNFRYISQHWPGARHQSLDVGVNIYNKLVFAGVNYKLNVFRSYLGNTDAAVFNFGFTSDFSPGVSYRLSYSYDVNFRGVSNGNVGTHEITYVMVFKNTCRSKTNRINKKDCFDYAKKGIESVF